MTAAFSLAGGILLVLCGAGAGYLLALHFRDGWRSVHAFGRLLEYLGTAVRFQAATGEQLLARAADYPEFARLGLSGCRRFGEIPLPDSFEAALRAELASDLHALETAGRATACELLARMAALSQGQEALLRERAAHAMHLYPRLGGCLGALLAIALL